MQPMRAEGPETNIPINSKCKLANDLILRVCQTDWRHSACILVIRFSHGKHASLFGQHFEVSA